MLTDWGLNHGPVSKLINEYMVTKGRGSAGVLKTVTGNPISVTDALAAKIKSLTVDMSPIQDLNGQPNPYPSGGGKNKIPFPYTMGSEITVNGITATVSSDGTVTLNGTATAQAEFPLIATYMDLPAGTYTLSGLPSGGSATTFLYNAYAFDENGTKLFDYRIPFSRTVTANNPIKRMYIYIRVAEGYTANNLVVKPQFEKGSTATAYAPYSNICPITGHESVTVKRTGKNLFDASDVEQDVYINDTNGTIKSEAGNAASGWIPVVPGATYYISPSLPSGNWGSFYDADKNFVSGINGYGANKPWVAPPNARYMRITVDRKGSNPNYATTTLVEVGSYTGVWSPFRSQTVTIQLGQTVYGGTIDMTAGTVTVDRAMVDMGTLTWAVANATANIFQTDSLTDMQIPSVRNAEGIICSALKISATTSLNTDMDDYAMLRATNLARLYVRDTSYSDAASFKAAMNGVAICYELAEPQTITLTPQSLALLKGSNTLWTDGDALTLTYKAEST